MIDEYFRGCLFFSSLAFHRQISRLAEQAFSVSGLSPMDAFLLMVVAENPGISQRDLGARLGQLESSVSRAVSSLMRGGYLVRSVEGKTAMLSLGEAGGKILPLIERCWEDLYRTYTEILGEDQALALTESLFDSGLKLTSD